MLFTSSDSSSKKNDMKQNIDKEPTFSPRQHYYNYGVNTSSEILNKRHFLRINYLKLQFINHEARQNYEQYLTQETKFLTALFAVVIPSTILFSIYLTLDVQSMIKSPNDFLSQMKVTIGFSLILCHLLISVMYLRSILDKDRILRDASEVANNSDDHLGVIWARDPGGSQNQTQSNSTSFDGTIVFVKGNTHAYVYV